MKKPYEIIIGDDPDSDQLFAEIYFNDEYFAELQEPPPYEIVIYPPASGGAWSVPLELLQEAVEKAKARLDEMQPLNG